MSVFDKAGHVVKALRARRGGMTIAEIKDYLDAFTLNDMSASSIRWYLESLRIAPYHLVFYTLEQSVTGIQKRWHAKETPDTVQVQTETTGTRGAS